LMLSISFLSVNNTVRTILRIAVVVLAVLSLIFVILSWTIAFDHLRLFKKLQGDSSICSGAGYSGGPNCYLVGSTDTPISASNLLKGAGKILWGFHAGWAFALVNTIVAVVILGLGIWGLILRSGKIQNENDYRLFEKT